MEKLYSNQHICVVLYGHPMVFAQLVPGAIKNAQRNGYLAKVLPAISAEDCFFADLLVDPGSCGCMSYEATDLLLHRRPITPSSHLIIWQIGVIGILTHTQDHDNSNGIKLLINFLSDYYPLSHEVIVYEAAQYPSFGPIGQKIQLGQLQTANITRLSTLYCSPVVKLTCDTEMLKALNINTEDLQ